MGLATTWQDYTVISSLRQTVRCLGTLDLAELEGRLSGTVCLTFRDGLLTDYYVA